MEGDYSPSFVYPPHKVTKIVTMYDTVHLKLNAQDVGKIQLCDHIEKYLPTIKKVSTTQIGKEVQGFINNLNVFANDDMVTIHKGSLCKFYLGNNIETLERSDAKRAIEMICDVLHLPFELAQVTRLDLGQNIILKNPVIEYFNLFGQASRYKQQEFPNGIYYKTSHRELVFYDKISEVIRNKGEIPELYLNTNLLRYELRFKTNVNQQLKTTVTAESLYDEKFYRSLIKRWTYESKKIKIVHSNLHDIKPCKSSLELKNILAAIAIQTMGVNKIYRLLQQWQKARLITKKQASDHRNMLNKILSLNFSDENKKMMEEIKSKIYLLSRF